MSTRQVILDTETTGLDPSKGHRLTEIGCLEMINRRLTGKRFQTYINPERVIDPGALAITGITTEFLQDKPKFIEIVEQFLIFIEGAELIIHNAPFDLSFINTELSLINHPWEKVENKVTVFDTLTFARRLHPGQKNNLDALCKRYNVDNSHREFHGALLDAEILSKVYLLMTAGQTSLSLSEEPLHAEKFGREGEVRGSKKESKRVRSLTVIKATEEEIRAHEAYMQEITA